MTEKSQKETVVEIFTPESIRLYAQGKLCDDAREDIEALIRTDDRAARYLAEIEWSADHPRDFPMAMPTAPCGLSTISKRWQKH